jgi:hypothetical protein
MVQVKPPAGGGESTSRLGGRPLPAESRTPPIAAGRPGGASLTPCRKKPEVKSLPEDPEPAPAWPGRQKINYIYSANPEILPILRQADPPSPELKAA